MWGKSWMRYNPLVIPYSNIILSDMLIRNMLIFFCAQIENWIARKEPTYNQHGWTNTTSVEINNMLGLSIWLKWVYAYCPTMEANYLHNKEQPNDRSR